MGTLVAVTVGVIAKTQQSDSPSGYFDLFFSDPIHLKAWFATAAALLGCVQLFTAAWIFRKLPLHKPPIVNVIHRWSGRLALVCTLPVAYHCIFKLGFHGDRGAACSFTRSPAALSTAPTWPRCRSCACAAFPAGCCPSPAARCSRS